ncbi:MAG: bifunctional riboflavin kinase/FAD synthetase [Terriglobia bacterium]
MQIINGLENAGAGLKKRVVTIGLFDGVHLGHRRVIEEAVHEAARTEAESMVMTFEPHPLTIIKGRGTPPILTDVHSKALLIGRLGVNLFLVARFDEVLSRMDPDAFVRDVLVNRVRAETVVVGENFKFGRDRAGDVETLKRICREYAVNVIAVPSLVIGGTSVSSTAVRKLLKAGHVGKVREMLGRFPTLRGRVVAGRGEGRTLGFKTANLQLFDDPLIPANGVYAGYVLINGTKRPCAVYIGTSPTFDLTEVRVEIHVFGIDTDLYGRDVTVEFKDRVREERKFPSKDALSAQIKKDVAKAKSIL